MTGGHLFMSYAHADIDYVRRLVDFLRGEGVVVWIDEQIPTSVRWLQELESRIDTCAAVVTVMSSAARESYWVGVELEHARRRQRPIFPLLLDGEPRFELGGLQYESAVGERMPSLALVQQLRDLPSAAGSPVANGSAPLRVRQVGVVPAAADCLQHRAVAERLDAALAERGSAIVTQILSGLGGVGKTQLAASVVRQLVARGAVDDLVWVTASTAGAIVSTLAEAGASWTGAASDDPMAVARRLLSWLATTPRRWLIVFDDLADPNDLNDWWPPTSTSGRVLVTTRRRDDALMRHGQRVDVELFTPQEARRYLTEKFGDQAQRLVEADELATDLGLLPVALAQAAAYIADRDLTCAMYRQRFAAHPLAALAPQVWPDAYARSVAVTLSLGVDAADQLDPVGLARPLLTLLSLLDANGIPIDLIRAAPVAQYLQTAAGRPIDADQAHDALTCLTRLNLTDTDAIGTTHDDEGNNPRRVLGVHALVQRAARDQSPPERLTAAAGAAADALLALWPHVERDAAFARLLRANTTALRDRAEDALWRPDAHRLLFRVGRSLAKAGLVRDAIEYFQHLNTQAMSRLGSDHPHTLATRHHIATWRGEAGDPAGAIAEFEELLNAYRRVLGPNHPDTLITRGNIASCRGEAGNPAGAVAAFEELLTDQLRVLDRDHPNTLATRHNIASWRGQAGDPAGAAAAFEELFNAYLQVLGPDHPDTLTTRNNIAVWRGEAGDPAGAVAALGELLTDRLRVLGRDHPDTLATRGNIASCRGLAGDPGGAVAAFEDLLADQLRVLGPDHPDTLRARNNIALWRGEAGEPTAAVAAFQDLLTDQLRTLGPDHPHTLTTRNNIALWRGEAGEPTAAVAAFQDLLTDQLRILGPDHPDTLTTRNNIASWRGEAGDETGAAAALDDLLTDQLRLLGPDHPHTLRTRNNIASCRGHAGDPASAAAALEQLLPDQLRVLGPDHPDALATRDNIAFWRGHAGNPAGSQRS